MKLAKRILVGTGVVMTATVGLALLLATASLRSQPLPFPLESVPLSEDVAIAKCHSVDAFIDSIPYSNAISSCGPAWSMTEFPTRAWTYTVVVDGTWKDKAVLSRTRNSFDTVLRLMLEDHGVRLP